MTLFQKNCYGLPADAASALMTGSIGKLTPVLTADAMAAPFTVLDSFDQSLRRSSRLLLESGGSFALLRSDGRVLAQTAQRRGQFVADFHEGPVKQALADVSPLRSLVAIGSGDMRRAVLAFLDDDQKTRCRAYLHFLTGTDGTVVVLVTPQGLPGYGKALIALNLRIAACGGTALNISRIYADLLPDYVAHAAKPDVIIKTTDTAFDAANSIIATYIPVMRANEAGIIADQDTEFLHDYRVALRKIRSVLSLLKGVYPEDQTADLKARFSALMVPTGPLRDIDVYLIQRPQFFHLLPKLFHSGLDTMFGMFAAQRQAEKTKLVRHFRSKQYERECTDLAGLFGRRTKLERGLTADLAAFDYARVLIWKRYRRICRFADRIGPETEDADMHALRIHCKKLRYLMESFGPLFPKEEFKPLLRPLKHLQDNLGQINDYSVQQASLQAFLQKGHAWDDAVMLAVAQSVGALIAELHRRQCEERGKIVESFAQFGNPQTQKTFRGLFHQRKNKK